MFHRGSQDGYFVRTNPFSPETLSLLGCGTMTAARLSSILDALNFQTRSMVSSGRFVVLNTISLYFSLWLISTEFPCQVEDPASSRSNSIVTVFEESSMVAVRSTPSSIPGICAGPV